MKKKSVGRAIQLIVAGVLISGVAVPAQSQDDSPAPERPASIGPGTLLSNSTIELRRPASPPESEVEESRAETPNEISPEAGSDSTTPESTSPDPLELDDSTAASAEKNIPLGTDSGLFALGQGTRLSEDESAGSFTAGIGGELIRTLGGLAVVLGLLFGMFLLVRRFGGPMAGAKRPSGVLEIMARYPLGRRQHLVILKMGRRVLLLHQTGSEMRTLSDVHDPNEVADLLSRIEAGSRDSRFSDALERESTAYRSINQTGGAVKSARRAGQEVEMVDLTRNGNRWHRVLPGFGASA